jgi:hypothetical protein
MYGLVWSQYLGHKYYVPSTHQYLPRAHATQLTTSTVAQPDLS